MKEQEWIISNCPAPGCGKEVYNHVVFHAKRLRTYCSPTCVSRAAAERRRQRQGEASDQSAIWSMLQAPTCRICGNDALPYSGRGRVPWYCGEECRAKGAALARAEWRKRKIEENPYRRQSWEKESTWQARVNRLEADRLEQVAAYERRRPPASD